MATKLGIYNQALTEHLGERKLASLTASRAARRKLDTIWDNEFVKNCLEAGQWFFATRTVLMDYNPDYDPEFGYRYVFDRPTDWVRTTGIAVDEIFRNSILRYSDESDFISCDMTSIYFRYISDDAEWGGDLSRWPKSFSDYVAGELARRAGMSITQNVGLVNKLEAASEKLLKKARSKDALNQPTKFPQYSSWLTSRGMTGRNGRERGGSL